MVDLLSVVHALRAREITTASGIGLVVDSSTIEVGNSAVVARCKIMGSEQMMMLKCYYRTRRNAAIIYGSAYKRRELGVRTLRGFTEYIDILLLPWIEGTPLDGLLNNSSADYASLSREFDRMAYDLLGRPKAHGDIKPENIIVREDGTMELVDWDGAWEPHLHYNEGDEIGTAQYRHPLRRGIDFGKSIDDYSIALLSTMLAALATKQELFESLLSADKTLFDPQLIARHADEVLERAIATFVECRDVAHYRIATSLYSPTISLYGLRTFLEAALGVLPKSIGEDAEVERNGVYWGLKDGGSWVVPAIFDSVVMTRCGCYLAYDDYDLTLSIAKRPL